MVFQCGHNPDPVPALLLLSVGKSRAVICASTPVSAAVPDQIPFLSPSSGQKQRAIQEYEEYGNHLQLRVPRSGGRGFEVLFASCLSLHTSSSQIPLRTSKRSPAAPGSTTGC